MGCGRWSTLRPVSEWIFRRSCAIIGGLAVKSQGPIGEVPEWLNGTVSKTVVGLVPTVGSNPTLSAGYKFPQGSVCCTYCRT